ncbi:MAG: DUF1080 domain-containing protein [Verrucomicrobiota bacterium]
MKRNTTTRRRFLKTAAASAVALPFASLAKHHAASDWRPLFDGKTLEGWKATPRINVAGQLGKASSRDAVNSAIERVLTHHRNNDTDLYRHLGKWEVVDGAIEGGQDPVGSRMGAYLLTEETFGDFELEYEMRPDWQTDTGIYIRQHPVGTVGIQVLCDHRPNGGIGGFFTNGLGSYIAAPFFVDGDEGENYTVENLREGEFASSFPQAKISGAATFEQFRDIWKVNDWNRFRLRCVGANPVITTWINDLEIATLDSSDTGIEGYDPAIIGQRVGDRGHIGLEIHSNNPKRGWTQWAQGAVSRWRNIRVRELSS